MPWCKRAVREDLIPVGMYRLCVSVGLLGYPAPPVVKLLPSCCSPVAPGDQVCAGCRVDGMDATAVAVAAAVRAVNDLQGGGGIDGSTYVWGLRGGGGGLC